MSLISDTIDRMYDESIEKAPIHLRPARDHNYCGQEDDGFTCTKILNHEDDLHVAHGSLGGIHHRWGETNKETGA